MEGMKKDQKLPKVWDFEYVDVLDIYTKTVNKVGEAVCPSPLFCPPPSLLKV